jgi:hypothetical protein
MSFGHLNGAGPPRHVVSRPDLTTSFESVVLGSSHSFFGLLVYVVVASIFLDRDFHVVIWVLNWILIFRIWLVLRTFLDCVFFQLRKRLSALFHFADRLSRAFVLSENDPTPDVDVVGAR